MPQSLRRSFSAHRIKKPTDVSAFPKPKRPAHGRSNRESRIVRSAARVAMLAFLAYITFESAHATARAEPANTAEPTVHGARHAAFPLTASKNKRFLIRADGTPFFYLSDTNWELVRRATRADARHLIKERRKQGFSVISTVATGILDMLRDNAPLSLKNANGDHAFHDRDFSRPATTDGADPADPEQYDYWDHLDFIITTANDNGLVVALLPGWHGHYASGKLNEANARAYGRFLGKRLGHHDNIIWVLGGDTNITTNAPQQNNVISAAKSAIKSALGWLPTNQTVEVELFRELAAGIKAGEEKPHLMTFHPRTGNSSSTWLHHEPWLDFNMIQSGHGARDTANDTIVAHDYALRPVKPTLDGESRYEDHAVGYDPNQGWFDDYDTRQAAYWALFAGAHGHTYGSRGVWQMHEPHHTPYGDLRYPWRDALNLPGARQMRHVRNLLTSRPILSRAPNTTIVVEDNAPTQHRSRATSGDGYAFVYASAGHAFSVAIRSVAKGRVNAWWYDPRTAEATRIGSFSSTEMAVRKFTPPGSPGRGNDWILVLDDATKGFPPPGSQPLITR